MKEIILSQKIERDELLGGKYVQREGLKSARGSLQGNLIKVIIGPRRAGKSVFSIQMLEGLNFAYLNFDDERLVSTSDYDELLKNLGSGIGNSVSSIMKLAQYKCTHPPTSRLAGPRRTGSAERKGQRAKRID